MMGIAEIESGIARKLENLRDYSTAFAKCNRYKAKERQALADVLNALARYQRACHKTVEVYCAELRKKK